jgi:hypothetical protein
MSVGYIYPAGGQIGTTFDIEIGGLNVTQATAVFVSGDGVKAEIIKESGVAKKVVKKKYDDQSSPQLADRLKVRVTINKNAQPGLRDFRLQAEKGVSNKLPFEIGQYPNIMELGTSSLAKPNLVSNLPATLCGQIMPGERDYFSFKIEKGCTFVAAAKARAFVPYIADAVPGWFQAVISLRNSKGQELAFSDDYRNGVDPVIIVQIPETDTYTLLIHDAIFRGREDFNYRIEVGQIPYIKSIYPPIGVVGKTSKVDINGVNIEKSTTKFKPALEGKGSFSIKGIDGYVSNQVSFLSYNRSNEIVNSHSNKGLELNTVLFDSLTSQSVSKVYYFDLQKNEQLIVDVTARRLGSMLDGVLTLYNQSGKKVAEMDDKEDEMEGLLTHHADPLLTYKATEAGRYKLVLTDVLQGYGKEYYFAMERKERAGNFEVFVSPANFTIPQGGTGTFLIDVVSSDKKIYRLDLELKGLPKGFITSSMEVRGNKWEVSVTAPENAKEQSVDLKVFARNLASKKNNQPELQQAVAADNMMQAFYYTHHIPAVDFIAEVTKASPFSLHFSPETERNLQKPISVSVNDSILALKLIIHRKPGFNETVSLQLLRKSKQITLDPVEFKPGEVEKEIRLKLNLQEFGKNKGMRRPIAIVGTVNGKVDKKGKRSFENAQFRETTPILILELGN